MRYVLLHTFAHAVIRELALECGYSAAGIAEKIYAEVGERPMAGVLPGRFLVLASRPPTGYRRIPRRPARQAHRRGPALRSGRECQPY